MKTTIPLKEKPAADHKKKQLFVAIDHGLSFPQMEGLEHPFDILNLAASHDGVDGIIASLGIYRQAEKLGMSLSDKQRFVLVDYAVLQGDGCGTQLREREMIVKPEEAAIVNPHCFKMFLNLYEDPKELYRNCRDLERFTVFGAQHGIKSLAEIMFYGNRAFESPETQAAELIRGCRIAMELGADYLKIPAISDLSAIEIIADTLRLPIYLLGGNKQESYSKFLGQLKKLAECRVDGFMFGRNIWQSKDMSRTVNDILTILQQ